MTLKIKRKKIVFITIYMYFVFVSLLILKKNCKSADQVADQFSLLRAYLNVLMVWQGCMLQYLKTDQSLSGAGWCKSEQVANNERNI